MQCTVCCFGSSDMSRLRLAVCSPVFCCTGAADQEQMSAELERSKASVARLLKERDDLEEKLKALGKELRQAINEKSVQVREPMGLGRPGG